MKNDAQNDGLFRVMVLGTALAFGLLGAIAASMKDFFNGNAVFEFSWKTVVAFFVGAAVGWGFWRLVRHFSDKKSPMTNPPSQGFGATRDE